MKSAEIVPQSAKPESCEWFLNPEHTVFGGLRSYRRLPFSIFVEPGRPGDAQNDTYGTGDGHQSYEYLDEINDTDNPPGYSGYRSPEVVVVGTFESFESFIPRGTPRQRAVELFGFGEHHRRHYYAAGQGGYSNVFFQHEWISNDVYNMPRNDRTHWIAKTAKKVVKILKNKPNWRNMLTRTLGLRDTLVQTTSLVTFDGKPLFGSIPKILSTRVEHEAGAIAMESVAGTTFYDNQIWINVYNGRSRYEGLNREVALQKLLQARVITNKTTESFDEQIYRFQRRIWATEQFYRDTHRDVLAVVYANKTKMSGISSSTGHGNKSQELFQGFDYNHGLNVLWTGDEEIPCDW